MNVHFSSATDLHATPQEFFDKLNAEFDFTLDVCATSENAKCEIYYTKQDDGLKQAWRGNVWMNPPYGREIGRWMEKANESAKDGATVVCLVPARTDTKWWHEYAIQHEVRFIRGRLKFSNAKNSAPFPSAVIVMRAGLMPNLPALYDLAHKFREAADNLADMGKKHDLLNNYIDRNFRNTCDWRPDNEGNFYTSCDGLWTFNEDGPVENGFMFCPYCGGNIELHNVERMGGPDV